MITRTKKAFVILIITILEFSMVSGQIENTRWKATLQINGPVNSIIDFKRDSVSVYTTADSNIIEQMTYKKRDTLLSLLKFDGQSDCDNNTIGNYSFQLRGDSLLLRLVKDDCDDRSSVISNTVWKKLQVYPVIKVADAILKQYTGVYATDPAHPITISLENGILYAEGKNNNLPKSAFTPISASKFFLKIAAVEMDFVRDANGSVVKLISHEEKDYELKKIK